MIYEANQRSSACDFQLIRFRRDLYAPLNHQAEWKYTLYNSLILIEILIKISTFNSRALITKSRQVEKQS